MDIFFERLISVKKGFKTYLLQGLIIFAGIFLTAVCLWLSVAVPMLTVLAVGVIYGTFKLMNLLNIEYEYILTNGTFDVDKITAKSSRKRITSFECKDIIRAGKYNFSNPPVTDATENLIFCGSDANAYYVLVAVGGKKRLMVLSLDDKMKNAIKECVPRNASKYLFEEW